MELMELGDLINKWASFNTLGNISTAVNGQPSFMHTRSKSHFAIDKHHFGIHRLNMERTMEGNAQQWPMIQWQYHLSQWQHTMAQ